MSYVANVPYEILASLSMLVGTQAIKLSYIDDEGVAPILQKIETRYRNVKKCGRMHFLMN